MPSARPAATRSVSPGSTKKSRVSRRYSAISSSGTRTSLPNISSGRLGDGDVVVERLAHLLHAVGPDEQRHRQGDLRVLAVVALEITADEQVELLVAASELDIGLHGDRVHPLQQGIQELHHGDRSAIGVALGEVVALEHAGDRRRGRESQDRLHVHRLEPLGVVSDLGALSVQDVPELARASGPRTPARRPLDSRGRVSLLPEGSPTRAVKSPTMRTATCPRSWNCRSLCSTTAHPRVTAGAVGSRPSFTRRGRPSESFCSSPSVGTTSAGPASSWGRSAGPMGAAMLPAVGTRGAVRR